MEVKKVSDKNVGMGLNGFHLWWMVLSQEKEKMAQTDDNKWVLDWGPIIRGENRWEPCPFCIFVTYFLNYCLCEIPVEFFRPEVNANPKTRVIHKLCWQEKVGG